MYRRKLGALLLRIMSNRIQRYPTDKRTLAQKTKKKSRRKKTGNRNSDTKKKKRENSSIDKATTKNGCFKTRKNKDITTRLDEECMYEK